eukprot:GILI01015092.1.p1 GENE.GILI01015092.1~~GILI01015092.1.p1  ORF type:complete len:260 (+),score=37.02 GILI01015092.1:46-780(+)
MPINNAGGAYGVPQGFVVQQQAPQGSYQGQPVMGQPLGYNNTTNNNSAPPPPTPYYPPMPTNQIAPVVDNRGNTTVNWEALRLPFPESAGAPLGIPANPSADPNWKVQNGNATDEILENRICQGIKLKDCELRNCYVMDCVVKDSLCKGGYYSTCKLKDCEFQNTLCLISCVMDDSIAKFCGITNTQIREGDLQKCNTLDSKVVDSNVYGGTATRCNFSKCGIQDTLQTFCQVSESSTSARKCV